MDTIQLSKDIKEIAQKLDKLIAQSAGERVGFTLIVYTDGRASYVSNVDRETAIAEIKYLLSLWEQDMPDIPAHEVE